MRYVHGIKERRERNLRRDVDNSGEVSRNFGQSSKFSLRPHPGKRERDESMNWSGLAILLGEQC